VIVSDSDNGSDERQIENVKVGLFGVWQNIDPFPASRETFSDVYGLYFIIISC
jgi:hypothetical protein